MTAPGLPTGLTSRPLQLADSGAVTAVMAASEVALLGRALIEEAYLLGDWNRPSFDVAANRPSREHRSASRGLTTAFS